MIYRGYDISISFAGPQVRYSVYKDGEELIASTAANAAKAENEAMNWVDRQKKMAVNQ